MNYRIINANQKRKMNSICNNDYEMQWEDPEFMNIMLGKLPEIQHYSIEKDICDKVSNLSKLLKKYNQFDTDIELFCEEVKNAISEIQVIQPNWFGLSYYDVEERVRLHRGCLISGEGGIGKSYFFKMLEEELEKRNIPHLCIYGKFFKSFDGVEIEEIINCKTGFVLMVDAVNEMNLDGQKKLLRFLQEVISVRSIRVVLSYRNNTLEPTILKQLKMYTQTEYSFQGVSFESALNILLEHAIPDVYKYEDILYSNNALFLNMLCVVLSKKKIAEEQVNSIVSITYILEHFIKNTIGNTYKSQLNSYGKEIWEDTKLVAKWMYENNEKSIPEDTLFSVINTGKDFVEIMLQTGLISNIDYGSRSKYIFAIDSITDFLIARSLFEAISGKPIDEKVAIINEKREKLYGIEEAIILVLFDNLSPDYETILEIIKRTELIDCFEYSLLIKVVFKQEEIDRFQNVFIPNNPETLLKIMGGYTAKPYNCTNFLNKYYNSPDKQRRELSNIFEGTHFLNDVKGRLKNVLYFLSVDSSSDSRVKEAFYFSVFCCAAPNSDVRSIATKLLYEIVSKNDSYKCQLIDRYSFYSDGYIREAIVHVLSRLDSNDSDVKCFFYRLVADESRITAKGLRRIATYLGKPYGYIEWERDNLYVKQEKCKISHRMSSVLSRVELMNKEFFPFRYWGENHIDMRSRFLEEDKSHIRLFNRELAQKYSCVRNGICNGTLSFKDKVMQRMEKHFDVIDDASMFCSFENIIEEVFNEYLDGDSIENYQINDGFVNSTYMKCVDLSFGYYYGSLMCNYYVDRFATYDNYQDCIGFEVYDPLEYGEDLSLETPMSTYNSYVEGLGDIILDRIILPDEKNDNWAKNVELTRKNLMTLFEPIEANNDIWSLLAGRVSVSEEDGNETKWIDTYEIWCCTSPEETIYADGNARYRTIELDDYCGTLNEYKQTKNQPFLCKRVRPILYGSGVFDDTSLVLPPAEIISFFDLHVDTCDMSWKTSAGDKIILCNNNKNSYYKDSIGSTVYIKKEYLEIFLANHPIKYFAFTERFTPETGYAEDTSLHFEIVDREIQKEIKNDAYDDRKEEEYSACSCCPFDFNSKSNDEGICSIDIDSILKEYGM